MHIAALQGQQMMFVVEVKAPNRNGTKDNVFESGLVAGQIWLYLMGLPSNHHLQPAFAAFLVAGSDTAFFRYSNGSYSHGTKWLSEYDRRRGRQYGVVPPIQQQ